MNRDTLHEIRYIKKQILTLIQIILYIVRLNGINCWHYLGARYPPNFVWITDFMLSFWKGFWRNLTKFSSRWTNLAGIYSENASAKSNLVKARLFWRVLFRVERRQPFFQSKVTTCLWINGCADASLIPYPKGKTSNLCVVYVACNQLTYPRSTTVL